MTRRGFFARIAAAAIAGVAIIETKAIIAPARRPTGGLFDPFDDIAGMWKARCLERMEGFDFYIDRIVPCEIVSPAEDQRKMNAQYSQLCEATALAPARKFKNHLRESSW